MSRYRLDKKIHIMTFVTIPVANNAPPTIACVLLFDNNNANPIITIKENIVIINMYNDTLYMEYICS